MYSFKYLNYKVNLDLDEVLKTLQYELEINTYALTKSEVRPFSHTSLESQDLPEAVILYKGTEAEIVKYIVNVLNTLDNKYTKTYTEYMIEFGYEIIPHTYNVVPKTYFKTNFPNIKNILFTGTKKEIEKWLISQGNWEKAYKLYKHIDS